jgi:hypothetical protein
MENHKVVSSRWTNSIIVHSNYENPWNSDLYEDFIEKTMDYLKSFHTDNADLDENDFEEAANDLLLGISLIRWQCNFGVRLLTLVNFLDKQFESSLYHKSKEEYRRYKESRQNRIDLEVDED